MSCNKINKINMKAKLVRESLNEGGAGPVDIDGYVNSFKKFCSNLLEIFKKQYVEKLNIYKEKGGTAGEGFDKYTSKYLKTLLYNIKGKKRVFEEKFKSQKNLGDTNSNVVDKILFDEFSEKVNNVIEECIDLAHEFTQIKNPIK